MTRQKVAVWLLNQTPLLLFLIIFCGLGMLSDRFLQPTNLVNILIQTSSLAVAATGMTFVLLTAGVDLSVGSVMFVAVAASGKLQYHGYPIALALAAGCLVGFLAGGINGLAVVRLRIIPFVATLAMLFIARGFGLWLTNTRAMNMPDEVTQLGASRWLGVPLPVMAMLVVALSSQWFLSWTPWGRQTYAIGFDAAAARRAGLKVDRVTFLVYVFCGFCAALSGMISLTQTGAVSPSFGQQREFAAIAAAVLGGTSLFGGRGTVFPGTLFGAVVFQTIENGLVIINADPYLYPLIISGIIFLAVLLDTMRNRLVAKLTRRHIRPA
jgi:ribose transport system permease protein